MIRTRAMVLESSSHALAVEAPGWPGHRPGQFAMLSLDPDGLCRDPLLPRPMAVYRGDARRLEFRFKPVGRGTRLLGRLAAGARLGVVGPLGNGFAEPTGRALLVGGGTGIASLYPLAAQLGSGTHVLLGGRTREDILGLDDFRALPVTLEITTEDGSLGHRGRVTDRFRPRREDEVYACGPTPMMDRVHVLARQSGARCHVSLEAHMACGFGVCLGCAVPTHEGYRYVCTHGPVFDAGSLAWESLP